MEKITTNNEVFFAQVQCVWTVGVRVGRVKSSRSAIVAALQSHRWDQRERNTKRNTQNETSIKRWNTHSGTQHKKKTDKNANKTK